VPALPPSAGAIEFAQPENADFESHQRFHSRQQNFETSTFFVDSKAVDFKASFCESLQAVGRHGPAGRRLYFVV